MPDKETSLPNYEVVPLRSDEIVVGAIQMRRMIVDGKNPKPGIKAYLDHMLYLIDAAQHSALALLRRHDLLAFPEFSVQGVDVRWTREDWLRVAIEKADGQRIKVDPKNDEWINLWENYKKELNLPPLGGPQA